MMDSNIPNWGKKPAGPAIPSAGRGGIQSKGQAIFHLFSNDLRAREKRDEQPTIKILKIHESEFL